MGNNQATIYTYEAEEDNGFIAIKYCLSAQHTLPTRAINYSNKVDLEQQADNFYQEIVQSFPTRGIAISVCFPRGQRKPSGWKSSKWNDMKYSFPNDKQKGAES